METIYSNIELARQFHCRSFQEGRKGGGGGLGVAHGSRESKSKIRGSRKLKQTFHESRTFSVCFDLIHPYSTTELTC